MGYRLITAVLLAVGCAGEAGGPPGGGGGGGGTGGAGACVGTTVVTPKRVVRLSEHQLFGAYTALFGSDAAAEITRDEDRPSLLDREFPPISGDIGFSEGLLAESDRLAQAGMDYVSRNAATLTPCGATPSDKACVQEFLLSFAEAAFRHPLTSAEQTAITGQFWTEISTAGATLAEALGTGVYGVLSSPSFLYRTELGADVGADGPLTPHELASAIAFFLTDAPPDAELLAAAASNGLRTHDQIRAQATRLLETPEARANLESALVKYFALTRAPTV